MTSGLFSRISFFSSHNSFSLLFSTSVCLTAAVLYKSTKETNWFHCEERKTSQSVQLVSGVLQIDAVVGSLVCLLRFKSVSQPLCIILSVIDSLIYSDISILVLSLHNPIVFTVALKVLETMICLLWGMRVSKYIELSWDMATRNLKQWFASLINLFFFLKLLCLVSFTS